MPRQPRFCSETGIYHVMMRGNEKKDIFIDQNDGKKFISIMIKVQREAELKVYAFCLMCNHFHLLCEQGTESLSVTMKRLSVSYAKYFNEKYERVGHLFQGRFLSQPIESDRYMLAVARYIHNNPCKAKLVQHPGEYLWSSYHAYLCRTSKNNSKAQGMIARCEQGGLVSTSFLLSMFQEDQDAAVSDFVDFMTNYAATFEEDDKIEASLVSGSKKPTAKEQFGAVISKKLTELKVEEAFLLGNSIEPKQRDAIIRQLKRSLPISMRQLAECLGLSKDTIARACRTVTDEN